MRWVSVPSRIRICILSLAALHILLSCCRSWKYIATRGRCRKNPGKRLWSRWDLDLRQIPNGFRSNFLSGGVELIDSPSIRRRGMSKNFPNKCFVNRTSWPNLCILFFSSLPQLQRPFEYDSCHASSSIFAKYVYLHLTSGHYMAYDKITKVV